MLTFNVAVRLALATVLVVPSVTAAFGHGVVGSRFFPATIATGDPFVADELSLPTVSHQKTGTDPSVKQTNIDAEFSKRITPISASPSDTVGPISTRPGRRAIRAVSIISKSHRNTSSSAMRNTKRF